MFRFYDERKPEIVLFPSTSELKIFLSVDINDNAMEDEDGDGDIMAFLQEVEVENELTINNDVLGQGCSTKVI